MLRLRFALLASLTACGATSFAPIGAPCSPSQACDDGLTCRQGRCVLVEVQLPSMGGGTGGGTSSAGGSAVVDAGLSSDAGHDAGIDAGSTVVDAGSTADAGVDAGSLTDAGLDAGSVFIGPGALSADGGLCACVTPPAGRCAGNTLEAAELVGQCTARGCEYRLTRTSCSNGCSNGRCVGSGWNSTSVDAGILFVRDVDGTASDDVWVAGRYGAGVVHWNGTQWAASFLGRPTDVEVIVASARDDVSLITSDGVLMHFDGARWAAVVQLPWSLRVMCAQAIGREDLLLAHTSGMSSPMQLVRITRGRVTTLGSGAVSAPGSSAAPDSCRLLARSLDDIWVGDSLRGLWHWDGQQLAQVPNGPAVRGLAFIGEELWVTGSSLYVLRSGTFRTFNPPVGWAYTALAGFASNELFLGAQKYATNSYLAAFDGDAGVKVPGTDTPGLPVEFWKSPTGDIFSVFSDGTVLHGP